MHFKEFISHKFSYIHFILVLPLLVIGKAFIGYNNLDKVILNNGIQR